MSENTTLARRHLLTALGIGAAALLSKAAYAQPVPPPIEDTSIYYPPLQQIPGWVYEWELAARNIGHYQFEIGRPTRNPTSTTLSLRLAHHRQVF